MLLNRGDALFDDAVGYPLRWTYRTRAVIAVDLDGDADLDLAVSHFNNGAAGSVSVLLNRGDGTFRAEADYELGWDPQTLEAGDFNGDGTLDLASSGYTRNDVAILLNRGDGTFPAPARYSTGSNPQSVTAADLDGDSAPDVALANMGTGTVTVALNGGGGAFGTRLYYSAGDGARAIAAADLDGDGGPRAHGRESQDEYAEPALQRR